MTLLLALAAAALPAAQEGVGPIEIDEKTIDISGADHHATFACKGRNVIIAGSKHVIVLTGVCASIDISGASNQVTVALQPGGALVVAGYGHKVRWKSTGDIKRDVSGSGNQVVRLAN